MKLVSATHITKDKSALGNLISIVNGLNLAINRFDTWGLY